jgi:hypothetical protein
VYDLQHYVPESCRKSFNGVLGNLNTFRAFAEAVDDWLITGTHDDYQDKVRLLVDKLGTCEQGLRGHLATLREDAKRCRPNYVIMRLIKSIE